MNFTSVCDHLDHILDFNWCRVAGLSRQCFFFYLIQSTVNAFEAILQSLSCTCNTCTLCLKEGSLILIPVVFFFILFSEEMNNYALSEDSFGKKTYIRFNSRAGESVTLSNVRIDSSTMQELTDAVSISNRYPIYCVFMSLSSWLTKKCFHNVVFSVTTFGSFVQRNIFMNATWILSACVAMSFSTSECYRSDPVTFLSSRADKGAAASNRQVWLLVRSLSSAFAAWSTSCFRNDFNWGVLVASTLGKPNPSLISNLSGFFSFFEKRFFNVPEVFSKTVTSLDIGRLLSAAFSSASCLSVSAQDWEGCLGIGHSDQLRDQLKLLL